MVTIGIYHDTRRPKADGACPICLRLTMNRKTCYVSTFMYAAINEFSNGRFTKAASNCTAKNAKLSRILSSCEDEILMLERIERLPSMTLKEISSKINEVINGKKEGNKVFTDYMEEYIRRGFRPNTIATYRQTIDKIRLFDKDATFETITRKWLESFDLNMKDSGMKVNSRSIHLRNIRAVFNYAIDEEYTSLYPFRKFKMAKEETAKRSLTIEQLRAFICCDCEEYLDMYRDIFMLMFYLIGINSVDLLNAKKSQITNGRLEYRRAKTNKLYSVKIQPEAQAIIDRYEGKEYLLKFMEERKSYNAFASSTVNRALRRIGDYEFGKYGKVSRMPIAPNLSTYWSRHTWATIAAELDIPKETISEALGHEIGSRVTSVYIKFNQKKVDEANRKVIDYILGK